MRFNLSLANTVSIFSLSEAGLRLLCNCSLEHKYATDVKRCYIIYNFIWNHIPIDFTLNAKLD